MSEIIAKCEFLGSMQEEKLFGSRPRSHGVASSAHDPIIAQFMAPLLSQYAVFYVRRQHTFVTLFRADDVFSLLLRVTVVERRLTAHYI